MSSSHAADLQARPGLTPSTTKIPIATSSLHDQSHLHLQLQLHPLNISPISLLRIESAFTSAPLFPSPTVSFPQHDISMFTFCSLQGAQSASSASQSLLELDGGVKVLIDVGWDESFDVAKLRELEK